MVGPFSLRVSAEPVCVALAIDVARRYAEIAGGSAAAAQALAASVAATLDVVGDGGEATDLAFSSDADAVKVTLSCGGNHEVCSVPLA